MAQRHSHRARVITAFVRRPQELDDGKVRCLGCSAVVGLTKNGKIRRHKSPAGEDCAYTASYAPPVHLDELPAVVIPPQPQPPTTRVPIRQRPVGPQIEDVERDARLALRNGECVDCGTWLPGERTLCNRCQRRRNAAKGRTT